MIVSWIRLKPASMLSAVRVWASWFVQGCSDLAASDPMATKHVEKFTVDAQPPGFLRRSLTASAVDSMEISALLLSPPSVMQNNWKVCASGFVGCAFRSASAAACVWSNACNKAWYKAVPPLARKPLTVDSRSARTNWVSRLI